MNPANWSGHVLGQGEPEKVPGDSVSWAARRMFTQAIRSDFSMGLPSAALETKEPGATFDPGDYYPGTIVFFGLEQLMRGNNLDHMANMEGFRGLPLPEPHTSLDINVKNQAADRYGMTFIEGYGAFYQHTIQVGVVVPDRSQGHTLLAVHGGNIHEAGRGVHITSSPKKVQTPVEVGRAHHYRRGRRGNERLVKVSRLEVRAYGQPTERGKLLPRDIGRRAVRPVV
jgi:hypothetical protein